MRAACFFPLCRFTLFFSCGSTIFSGGRFLFVPSMPMQRNCFDFSFDSTEARLSETEVACVRREYDQKSSAAGSGRRKREWLEGHLAAVRFACRGNDVVEHVVSMRVQLVVAIDEAVVATVPAATQRSGTRRTTKQYKNKDRTGQDRSERGKVSGGES
jgi:hypothetical protein